MIKIVSAIQIFLFLITISEAQTASEYFQQANEAYERKDYAANVQLLEKSIQAGADHPTVLYFLARGYALNANQESAIRTLNRLADMGLSYKPEEDSQFVTLHKVADFNTVVEKFRANLKPIQSSKPAITITDHSFIPEGIAYDPSAKTFLFGGIGKNQILSYRDGDWKEFSSTGDGLWSVLGMKLDPGSGRLWVASSALTGEDKGESGIFEYDLKQGKLVNKFLLEKGNHGLGEVVVDSKGNVYATDSVSPAIYFLNKGKLEMFLGPDPFRSPQGACLSQDEKILFVADYSRGIFAIDLATRKYWKLNRTEGTTTVAGIDGLYRYGKDLIAIQNGVTPHRVLRIAVNDSNATIESVKVLESNHEVYPEPTLGVIVEDDFYYVGNSMIGPYLENPKTELKPAVILKLKL